MRQSAAGHVAWVLRRLWLVQIMQVKNFGRRGRTKYTHLVDQARACYAACLCLLCGLCG